MKNKKGKIIVLIIFILSVIILGIILFLKINKKDSSVLVNLTDLTYTINNKIQNIKKYSAEDFDVFYNDYENKSLPEIYLTEFVFDGVSMYNAPDLDDFIEKGNDIKLKTLKINAVNINIAGDVTLEGNLTGMILINTNDIDNDINIILNNVNINTDSKKVPAIYVYNKDITYSKHKVTIKTLDNTKNYIEGGKFKKVSLVPKDDLNSYSSKYSSDNKTNYNTYTNYYGIYTKAEIENILFAKIEADNEDLKDGDPYYFYKAAGAVSSDIDLYFSGTGYLKITSKNKEGVETKGNLSFVGGAGDYYIEASDDCLNTTTDSAYNGARNTLTIDVNSLTAIVSLDADEGDAIDSNGTLVINGGTIIALAHPGSDAGLDSSKGTYINGGTIYATGDMYDEISSESKQRFVVLSFSEKFSDDIIAMYDSNDLPIFAFNPERTYTNFIYSSSSLVDGTYTLYKVTTTSEGSNGVYSLDNLTKDTQLAYSSTGVSGMGPMGNGMNNPGDMPSDMGGQQNDMGEPPTIPNDMNNQQGIGEPPAKPDGDAMDNNIGIQGNTINKEFTTNGISNLFSGVATYKG
nr:carbohydrate-binding domain-containing protein [Bacilli bacterium]